MAKLVTNKQFVCMRDNSSTIHVLFRNNKIYNEHAFKQKKKAFSKVIIGR